MDLITPGIGLVFWTTLSFLIVLFILSKAAWKPMLKALKEREENIDGALAEAEKARQEMASLQSDNEKLLKEAREERDRMLTEARDTHGTIVGKAKGDAKAEADRLIAGAREEIRSEKRAAQTEIKNMVAQLSIEIAEKVIKERLSNDEKQKALVNSLIEDLNLN